MLPEVLHSAFLHKDSGQVRMGVTQENKYSQMRTLQNKSYQSEKEITEREKKALLSGLKQKYREP